MLLVQQISLTWNKSDRGGAGAAVRSGFTQAYPFRFCSPAGQPAKTSANGPPGALVQRLDFWQKGGHFLDTAQRWQSASAPEKLDLANIAFYLQADGLAVRFYWDERRGGMPYRRGHNEDFGNPASRFCGRDCLNETAFLLAPGQYGRLLWNERRSWEDGWYYQLHLCNLYLVPEGGSWAEDIFTCRRPDAVYRQLADLY